MADTRETRDDNSASSSLTTTFGGSLPTGRLFAVESMMKESFRRVVMAHHRPRQVFSGHYVPVNTTPDSSAEIVAAQPNPVPRAGLS